MENGERQNAYFNVCSVSPKNMTEIRTDTSMLFLSFTIRRYFGRIILISSLIASLKEITSQSY